MSVLQSVSRLFGRRLSRKIDLSKHYELNKIPIKASTSIVHVAIDKSTRLKYALKIIDPAKTAAIRNRFQTMPFPSEGLIQQQFQPVSEIVTVHQTGRTMQDQEFIVMDWIDGPTLDQLALPEEYDKLPNRISLMLQMARALEAVHKQGFVHRDICPRNFLLSKDLRNVKLFDFGLTIPDRDAYSNHTSRSGTPEFLAPEIVRRRPCDKRVDLFAFGVTLYQMFAGHHPWGTVESNSRAALVHDSRVATDIREHRPKLNPRLVKVIHRCLEINVDQRMPNLKNFLAQSSDIKKEFGD